jgi:hypothetical protein
MTYHAMQCTTSGKWLVMFDDGTRPHGVFDARAEAEREAARRNAECLGSAAAELGPGCAEQTGPRTVSGTFSLEQEIRVPNGPGGCATNASNAQDQSQAAASA